MMLLAWDAAASVLPAWDCADLELGSLADAKPYADEVLAGFDATELQDWIDVRLEGNDCVPESCVGEGRADDDSYQSSCEQFACILPSGEVAVWRLMEEHERLWPQDDRSSVEEWDVWTPDGQEVYLRRGSSWHQDSDVAGDTTDSVAATWSGGPVADWVADGSLLAWVSASYDSFFGETTYNAGWTSGTCEVRAGHSRFTAFESAWVTLGAHVGEVSYDIGGCVSVWVGEWDGVALGALNSDWSAASDDVDNDGVRVADGDCDDADPTISPCEAEIDGDSIDQDCDEVAPRPPPSATTHREGAAAQGCAAVGSPAGSAWLAGILFVWRRRWAGSPSTRST